MPFRHAQPTNLDTEMNHELYIPFSGENSFFFELYRRYQRDPQSVPIDWRIHFEALDDDEKSGQASGTADATAQALVAVYRQEGHRVASLDPLGLSSGNPGATMASLREKAAATDSQCRYRLAGEERIGRLQDVEKELRSIYGGTVALEAGHIQDEAVRNWIYETYEREMLAPPDAESLIRVGDTIARADTFENFCKIKFVGKKRFGIEGAEGSVVLLRELLRHAAHAGVAEVVAGGMHRGRLATLVTVLGKSPALLFAELKGADLTNASSDFTGDVPYHLGHTAELTFGSHELKVSISPHPSHLMVVAPVVLGYARAKRDKSEGRAMSILLHTDAAFAGQGLSAEIMQMSGLQGYDTSGTVHIVVNNQIGFSTMPSEGRTASYCTDVGKMIGVPILHVNGDDPDAMLRAAQVAFSWRQKFGRDVLIDLVCYRKNGHNELDEPRFTQPGMWDVIDNHRTVFEIATAKIAEVAPYGVDHVQNTAKAFRTELEDAYEAVEGAFTNAYLHYQEGWEKISGSGAALLSRIETGINAKSLEALLRQTTEIPASVQAHPKVARFYQERVSNVLDEDKVDFATAEALAIASLLDEKVSVRISGQDCVRGTFTQRHWRVHDLKEAGTCTPVAFAAKDGATFDAINSPLTEYGILSFEYGYSTNSPQALTIWEAQFGDFLNCAQTVVDQFIVSAESKWRLKSGLVISLPHGLEGQGPDHSSARIERILQSCAHDNIVVVNPSTPANLFHVLRRQIHAFWRKPLFLISPKSPLRMKAAVSSVGDFIGKSHFLPVIGESIKDKTAIRRLILCSGKIFYDLAAAREDNGLNDRVAIVRIEQLYPLDMEAILKEIGSYGKCQDVIWCQEEAENQGAWKFIRDKLLEVDSDLALKIEYHGREALPVAAGGSVDRHGAEQSGIVKSALGI